VVALDLRLPPRFESSFKCPHRFEQTLEVLRSIPSHETSLDESPARSPEASGVTLHTDNRTIAALNGDENAGP
jgi:hypothetical protein